MWVPEGRGYRSERIAKYFDRDLRYCRNEYCVSVRRSGV